LNQIHFISPPAVGRHGPEYAAAAQIITLGEFRGMARWLTIPGPARHTQHLSEPERPVAGIDAGSEDPREDSDGLGALLASIADDVQHRATATRDGVIADFAGRAMHARKHLSRHLLAATLAALKEQRKAALALISRNAAVELAGRKKGAIEAFEGNGPRRGNKGPKPHGAAPTPRPIF
jgi:hypothetical protein